MVARLLRLSIKLGEQVELIEVLGSEMLSKEQKAQVKVVKKLWINVLALAWGLSLIAVRMMRGYRLLFPPFMVENTNSSCFVGK